MAHKGHKQYYMLQTIYVCKGELPRGVKNGEGESFGMFSSSRALNIKPNNLNMLEKHSTFALHPQPYKQKECKAG